MLIRKFLTSGLISKSLRPVRKSNLTLFSTNLNQNYLKKRNMDENLKVRPNPIVTKLDSPEFNSIFTNELYVLIDLFRKYKFEIRVAGGAVRDILMGVEPKDIDIATTATPDQMKNMFTKEKIRMINMKGEKHGTITPRINNKESFEVTTLRIDVLTDGRHAEVEFTKDWQLDANRRDLTINSMFLGFDGSVYDYFFGYEDLLQKRVVFVGNADTRIKEDYLRILRYFRFYGRIATDPNNHDEKTITAIKNNVKGLERISGERIWSELRKLLSGKFPYELMTTMLNCGVAEYIGLPANPNLEEFKRICECYENIVDEFQPILLLIGLLHTREDAVKMHDRLKLSGFERDLALFVTENREQSKTENDIVTYKKLCLRPYVYQEFVEELLNYCDKRELCLELKKWTIPRFHINGHILKENGCPPGKSIGIVMTKLKSIWADDNFQTTKEDLLQIHLPKILEEIRNTPEKKKFKPST